MSEASVTRAELYPRRLDPNGRSSWSVLPIFFLLTSFITWGTVGLYMVSARTCRPLQQGGSQR